MKKCVFLDRDGVLNIDAKTYTYAPERLELVPKLADALQKLKAAGFLLIVVTNQAGIAKGLYTEDAVWACHQKIQNACGGLLDDLYFAPSTPAVSESLGRKPGSLLFEKAVAKYRIAVAESWMLGDSPRDLIAAQKVGIPQRILIAPPSEKSEYATHQSKSLWEAVNAHILPRF